MTNAVLKLQDSGFSREQVEALTEFMSGSVATKEDVTDLRSEVKEDIAHLDGRIVALDGKITAEIATLRSEMKEDIAALRSEMSSLRGEMKEDTARLEGMIEAQGQRFNGKFTLLYWMLGLIIVVQVAPYLKMLFG